MQITNDIHYIGVNDHDIDLFEGQYIVENGMAYNSYVIMDEKIAVMDTVDTNFEEEWLGNLKSVLGSRIPDYLIVQHMEPDHSASIDAFVKAYPETVIVASAPAFTMMKQFFGTDYADKRQIIKEGDSLSLGTHTLQFVAAPMVHWPEVMVTYDAKDKVLFSADGFGKFGALDCNGEWDDEARRYYFGIVGKFGAQVQSLLKKLSPYEISRICPLHGPVLENNLAHYLELYDTWSSYKPEKEGVVIAYTSIYGHTKEAVLVLENMLKARGAEVTVLDLARADRPECIAQAFRYSKLVLATTTYNGTIFPAMREFIDCLVERNYRGRKVALIENGSWAPVAAAAMAEKLSKCKDLTFCKTTVKIRSALNEESQAQLSALADELIHK